MKLDDKTDMALFHIEQDIRDLEEEIVKKGRHGKLSLGTISNKLLRIADKLALQQNE